MAKRLSLVNGPNLNLLGTRETEVYGSLTLDKIVADTSAEAKSHGFDLDAFQSNIEGELVEAIHRASASDGLIVNPAAYTHTSIAIRDAIAAIDTPTVEVHLSNIYKRESFRHQSYVSQVCLGVIGGFGPQGYMLAVQALARHLKPAK